MLRDASTRDLSVELFGRRLASPFLLAPIGVLEMAHREADLAVARAAAGEGIPMILSSQASVPMEQCAAAMGEAPRWFQLYWSTSDELVESFVRRAEACGAEAIVLTLDTTMLGWRTGTWISARFRSCSGRGSRSTRATPCSTRSSTPTRSPGPRGQVTWKAVRSVVELSRRHPGSTLSNLRSGRPRAAVRLFLDIYSRPSLSWPQVEALRAMTRLPILLKGVLRPDDARRAVELGVDGIVVSNHGGRQIDGEVGALDALPPSSRPPAPPCRCSSTAGSAAAPTRSRRWRWEHAPS